MSNQLTGSTGPMTVRDIAGGFGNQMRGSLVFPATVNTADPVGLTELIDAQLSVTAAGAVRVTGAATGLVITPIAGALFSIIPGVQVDSLGATGRAVAPAAGGAIVTVAAPPAGTYEVEVLTSYDGAVAAAEINNMELREGAVVRSALLAPSVANVVTPVRTFILVLDGATAVSVNATAAGTAAVGYNAELVLRRVA